MWYFLRNTCIKSYHSGKYFTHSSKFFPFQPCKMVYEVISLRQEEANMQHKKHCDKQTKEGDDTMSAVAQNFVYQVYGKKDTQKKEPTVSKEKLEAIKAELGKYLSNGK